MKILIFIFLLLFVGNAGADQIRAVWNPSTDTTAEGTRFYRIDCNVPWVSNECSGLLDQILLVQRPRNPGTNDCAEADFGMIGNICYAYDFDALLGKSCYVVTAYRGVEEGDLGPIKCITTELEKLPPDPPRNLDLFIKCTNGAENCLLKEVL